MAVAKTMATPAPSPNPAMASHSVIPPWRAKKPRSPKSRLRIT